MRAQQLFQQDDATFLKELVSAPDSRQARALFSGGGGNNNVAAAAESGGRSCRGSVTSLSSGEATIVKSHASYGVDPYPGDYLCRWLFLSVDGCSLGLECKIGTRRNLRRSR
jgi:hypothetical protein